jgi:hypothetical protein
MKKVLIAAFALMMGASLSLAGLGIDWSNNGGWMYAYGSESEGVLENNTVLWQLIYSHDNVADQPDLTAAHFLGKDEDETPELLIAEREIPATGSGGTSSTTDGKSSWDEWLMPASGDTVTALVGEEEWTKAGWAYQRIWQGIPSNDIAENYYFDSSLIEIDLTYGTNPDAPSNPQALDYSPDGNGVTVNKVAEGTTVPEPATMSLLGLGALAMVLRRKLRK